MEPESKPVNTAPYLSLQGFKRWGLNPELFAYRGCVVRILFGGSSVSPARAVKPEQGNLHMFS